VRFAAGVAEAVGEKPLERVLPLDWKEVRTKVNLETDLV